MIEVKRILVPTDFSEEAIMAYTHAEDLASRFGAKIDMIHVVPTLKYFNESIKKMGVPIDLDVNEDLYPHVKDGARHRLQGLMDNYFSNAHRGTPHVLIGRKPFRIITDFAGEKQYDAIVMAARGEHSSDLLRGSITEKVIRHSSVPVISVDERMRAEGPARILLPTDGSKTSFACLPMALSLAYAYDSEITLFHVLELYGSLSESFKRHPELNEVSDIYHTLMEKLEEYVTNVMPGEVSVRRGEDEMEDELVLTHNGKKKVITLNTVIKRGLSAHYEIENYAPEHSDLVVMATHGHSGLAHFFLGSTTEKVAQHLDMPVVTCRPDKSVLASG